MVYNLCSEKDYDVKHFDGRVVNCGFDDHQVWILLELFSRVCNLLKYWIRLYAPELVNSLKPSSSLRGIK
jgi:hypothetical protein